MNTSKLSQHVTATGGITPGVYQRLDKMARAKQPGAANYRIAYLDMPVCWGCDDADYVAIVGLVAFTAAELLAAGFEPAVCEAQEIEIAVAAAKEASRIAERAARNQASRDDRQASLDSLTGRVLELPRKIQFDGNRLPFVHAETTSRFTVLKTEMKDMGGSNEQPCVTLEAEDGQTAYAFIRHLLDADKLDAAQQCAALIEFAL